VLLQQQGHLFREVEQLLQYLEEIHDLLNLEVLQYEWRLRKLSQWHELKLQQRIQLMSDNLGSVQLNHFLYYR